MVSEVSEYLVIRDESFRLEVNESENISFKLPGDAKINEHSVLFYMCMPIKKTVDVDYKIEINGRNADSGNMTWGTARTIREAVQGNILKPGENKIKFEVPEGTGNITFSDVVLLFKREV